jgi:putative ABC transport system ATP-binding protein
MSDRTLVDCRRLTKIYPLTGVDVQALRGIDLQVEQGEMVAVMGHSGSGKSTLMHIIGCMDRQTAGGYLFDGADPNEMNDRELAELRNSKLGFVFQRYNLLARSTALYNVELPLFYAGLSGEEAEQKAIEALELVGLDEYGSHWPNQLSGGQQQRVAIARAVVNNPLLILADEPTGALDTASSAEVMTIFQQMHLHHDVTVIIVTHEQEVANYCQRQVVMQDGLIISDRQVANRTMVC